MLSPNELTEKFNEMKMEAVVPMVITDSFISPPLDKERWYLLVWNNNSWSKNCHSSSLAYVSGNGDWYHQTKFPYSIQNKMDEMIEEIRNVYELLMI